MFYDDDGDDDDGDNVVIAILANLSENSSVSSIP